MERKITLEEKSYHRIEIIKQRKMKQKKIIHELDQIDSITDLPTYPKFQSQFNFKHKPIHKEWPEGPSLTQPGQSMSVREIMQRFTRGIDPMLTKMGSYSDTDDFDDIDITRDPAFDIVDAENFINEVEHKRSQQKAETQNKTANDITGPEQKSEDAIKGESEAKANKKSEQNNSGPVE